MFPDEGKCGNSNQGPPIRRGNRFVLYQTFLPRYRAAIPRVGAPLSGARNVLISCRGELIFACRREKKIVFRVLGGAFSRLGGVISCFGGWFSRCAAIYFARSAIFFLVLISIFSSWSWAKRGIASLHLATSIDRVIRDAIKTVFSAFGITYLLWPSDDAYFYYINRSALLIYSYYVLEASSQSFVVKRYDASKCVC